MYFIVNNMQNVGNTGIIVTPYAAHDRMRDFCTFCRGTAHTDGRVWGAMSVVFEHNFVKTAVHLENQNAAAPRPHMTQEM